MIKSFKKSFKKLKKNEKKFLGLGLLLSLFLPLIQDNPHSSCGIGQVATGLYILLAGASFKIGAESYLRNRGALGGTLVTYYTAPVKSFLLLHKFQ